MAQADPLRAIQRLLRRAFASPSLRLAALLGVAITAVALSSASRMRSAQAGLLMEIALVGAALGWTAAAVRLPAGLSAVVIGAAGLIRSVWRVARLGPSLAALLVAGLRAYWRWLPVPLPRSANPPPTQWEATAELLAAQLGTVSARMVGWLQGLLAADSSFDPLGAAMAWSLLFWCLAAWAAWQIRARSRPLAATTPLLALSAYTSFYTGAGPAALLVTLAATLLLMAYGSHHGRRTRWQRDDMVVAAGLGGRLTLAVLPLSAALVGVAAAVPSLSYERAVRWAQRASGQREAPQGALGESFGLEQAPQYDSPLYPARTPGLPNRHLVGSGDELSEQRVLTVTVFNLPIDGPPPRLYWRALTYDRYSGQGWVTTPTITWSYAAGQPTDLAFPEEHTLVRQIVRLAEGAPALTFHAGQLATIEQEFEVAWRTTGLDAFAATVDSRLYETRSRVADPTVAELRSAGVDYPQWVRERYLVLPDDVPDRVVAMARDLTARAPTPYDRARAIVEHLREIPYDLDVPLPPEDRDAVDWFLFDLRRGYCDYYASAMVVLARAGGLPARFVVGYYTGTPERTEGTYHYVVSAADAHSWVEVYFPDHGWVEFDPTAGRPPIERGAQPLTSEGGPPASLETIPRAQADLRGAASAVVRGVALTLAVGALGVLLLPIYDLLRLRRRHSREAVGALYGRFERLVGWLGLSRTPSPTPNELGRILGHRMRVHGSRTAARAQDVDRLIEISVRSAYGERPIRPEEVSAAWWSWWRLAPRLVLQALLAQLRESRSGNSGFRDAVDRGG